MAGVGIQQIFIVIFVLFAIKLHMVLLRSEGLAKQTQSRALILLYTVYAVLGFVTVRLSIRKYFKVFTLLTSHFHHQLRIIFRLCEYSEGLDSTIPSHEAYQYCLDSLPMLFASVLLNVVHPGRIMPGKQSNIPSRRERKKNGVSCKFEPLKFEPCEAGSRS